MNDTRSASLVLVAGAAGVAWWWFHITQGKLAPAAADTSPKDPTGGPALGPGSAHLPGSPLQQLEAFARANSLKITSETGGQHNSGSLHYQGRAIDVSSRGFTQQMVDALRQAAAAVGIKLRDERTRPAGQAVWGGPHLHLEIPR